MSGYIDTSGKPVIVGTDIKVSQIASEYEHQGMSPDEIIEAHPHLSLAAVHAALAYYYDHQGVIRQAWKEDRAFIEALRAQYKRSARSA